MRLKNHSWFANGKLLITGEYLVLDGAKALAFPLKLGQRLSVYSSLKKTLKWDAVSPRGTWFKASLKIPDLEVLETSDPSLSNRLLILLERILELAPDFAEQMKSTHVKTVLDFDPEYGFGSSSTLIYCLSKWAKIDPYLLQEKTFGGSGFDIACADAKSPISFQKMNRNIQVEEIQMPEEISKHVYFVYLGKKQQTSKSIQDFRDNASYTATDIETITSITNEVIKCKNLEEFEGLLREHEKLMSRILKTPTIQSTSFPKLKGCVKSLGAWGGDFVLITSHLNKTAFTAQMKKLGFPVSYAYSDLVMG